MLNKQQLLYFMAVCEQHSLSRAADKIGIAQSSLSLAIQSIEESLGVPLFIRHRRGVSLTHAGNLLKTHTKKMQDYWQQIESIITSTAREASGNYIIGCPAIIGQYYLAQRLTTLIKYYPKLNIEIQIKPSRLVLRDILQHNIDFGLSVNPAPQETLIQRRLYSDKSGFWIHQDLLPLTETIRCLYQGNLDQAKWLLKHANKKLLKNLALAPCDDLPMIAELVNQKFGAGILPATIATRYPDLRQIPESSQRADEIYAVYPKENRSLASIRAILSVLK